MTDQGTRSWAGGLGQVPIILLSIVGGVVLALMGPFIVFNAVIGSDPSWTPPMRILLATIGLCTTALLGSTVLLAIRHEVLGRPRCTISADGLDIDGVTTSWNVIGRVEIAKAVGRPYLAVDMPWAAIAALRPYDRYAAKLSPAKEDGFWTVHLTSRQLRLPIAEAWRRVPAEHRRA